MGLGGARYSKDTDTTEFFGPVNFDDYKQPIASTGGAPFNREAAPVIERETVVATFAISHGPFLFSPPFKAEAKALARQRKDNGKWDVFSKITLKNGWHMNRLAKNCSREKALKKMEKFYDEWRKQQEEEAKEAEKKAAKTAQPNNPSFGQ